MSNIFINQHLIIFLSFLGSASLLNETRSVNHPSKENKGQDKMEVDIIRQSSSMDDGSYSSQDITDVKTSSTRRKLRMPKKSAPKISPGQRRKSRRNLGLDANLTLIDSNKVLETVDKENEALCLISNIPISDTLNIETKSLFGPKSQKNERKIIRRSSSTYAPVILVTPNGRKMPGQSEEEPTKTITLKNNSPREKSIKSGNAILKEISSIVERKAKSAVSPSKLNMAIESLPESVQDPDLRKSKESKVFLERLSPQNEKLSTKSPVKVVNEKPLRIVPVLETNSSSIQPSVVARRINFDNMNLRLNINISNKEQDSEIIQDSQSTSPINGLQTAEMTQRHRKRRVSNIPGNAAKKAKKSHILVNRDKAAEANLRKFKTTTDNKMKRSKRIAQRSSLKVETPLDKEHGEAVTEIIDTVALQKQHESDISKNGEKGIDKQVGQKMRLNKYGESPLHVAVKRGDIEKVRSLLSDEADVNSKDHAGWRPIHEAMREGENALNIIRLLVEYNADVNARSDSGNTALHDAAAYMSEEIIKFLIDRGADATIENLDGKSPQDIAKMPQYGRGEEIRQILTGSLHAKTNIGEIIDEKTEREERDKQQDSYEVANETIDSIVANKRENQIGFNGKTTIEKMEECSGDSLSRFSFASEKQHDVGVEVENSVVAKTQDVEVVSNKGNPVVNFSGLDMKEKPTNPKHSLIKDDSLNEVVKEYLPQNCVEQAIRCTPQKDSNKYDVIQNINDDVKSIEQHHVKMPQPVISKTLTGSIQCSMRRLERRSTLPSPFGPSSRGAKLLEMANKKSKSVNNLSFPSINSTLNNSFTELNTSAGSSIGGEINDTDSNNSSAPSLPKFILMSPRIETRASLSTPLPISSVVQEVVRFF